MVRTTGSNRPAARSRLGVRRRRSTLVRRGAAALGVSLALLTPAFATSAHASPGTDLGGERAKAARIEAQIEANGNRVSVLDEQYLQAQSAIAAAGERIAAEESALARTARTARTARARLAARAVEVYMGSGNATPLQSLDATNASELGTRSAYASAAADQDRALAGRMKLATEELGLRRAALERARAAAVARRDELARTRDEINRATAEQEALLAQVNGRIRQLVAADEAARAAAEAAAARAAQARAAAARSAQLAASSAPAPAAGGPVAGPDVPAPNPQAQVAVDTAKAQLGKPYVYAGAGPDVFDCSGLTMYAWAAAGVALPHSAAAQYDMLPHVPLDAVVPGDLVFFGNPIHHVGMVVGGGMMIEAPFTGADVRYHSMYRPDFAGAARP